MKKILLLTAAMLTLATAAMAGGVNLSWNDCTASLGTNVNNTSLCTSNFAGAKNLYGTFVLDNDLPALNGNDIVMDCTVAGSVLPCWWNMTVAPRNTGYAINNVVCADGGGAGIFDYWASIPGGAVTGIAAKIQGPACLECPPNRVRFAMVAAVNADLAGLAPAGVELYSFTFRLQFGASVGACTGCLTPACFKLNLIRATQTNLPYVELTSAAHRDYVTWQGGVIDSPGCPAAVPTTNKTWGSVKALYR